MTKHLVNIVLNNFTNDSRVLKEALTQERMGFKVTVCALHSEGLPFQEKRGEILIDRQDIGRAKMHKGKFFGLMIYIKLIFMVIRKYRKADVWHCNDLEPLVIAWLAKIFNRKLTVIYDAHEYTRERNGRTGLLKWLVAKIEPVVIKCADEVITVSDGIVEEYKRLYNLEQVHLIRNAPHKKTEVKKMDLFRSKFPIPKENTIFLYQGAFTFGRGIDLLVDAFSELKSESVSLVFLGG